MVYSVCRTVDLWISFVNVSQSQQKKPISKSMQTHKTERRIETMGLQRREILSCITEPGSRHSTENNVSS